MGVTREEILKPSLTCFDAVVRDGDSPLRPHLQKGEMKKWPFRPYLKVKQLLEKLIFLLLILSITFMKYLVYYAKKYLFFSSSKSPLYYLILTCSVAPGEWWKSVLPQEEKNGEKNTSHHHRNNARKTHWYYHPTQCGKHTLGPLLSEKFFSSDKGTSSNKLPNCCLLRAGGGKEGLKKIASSKCFYCLKR